MTSRDRMGPRRTASRRNPAAPDASESDAGIATLLAIGVMLAIIVAGGLAIALGELAAARAALSSAADLAALAGALDAKLGPAAACSAARRSAARNAAKLNSCALVGQDIEVTVQRRSPTIIQLSARLAGRPAPLLLARARAGPSDSTSDPPP